MLTRKRSVRWVWAMMLLLLASCEKMPGGASGSGAAEAWAPARAATVEVATQAATQPAVVHIENFAFRPREIVVAAGTKVTWHNADDVPHTATSQGDPRVFDSGALDTDEKFSFVFSKPGEYGYFCKVHPHMTGVVIVK